jgi:hypothetical protein
MYNGAYLAWVNHLWNNLLVVGGIPIIRVLPAIGNGGLFFYSTCSLITSKKDYSQHFPNEHMFGIIELLTKRNEGFR